MGIEGGGNYPRNLLLLVEKINYVPGLKTKIANAVKDYVNGQIDLTGTVKVRFKIKYSLNYPKANEFSDYYYTFELDYQWAKQYNS